MSGNIAAPLSRARGARFVLEDNYTTYSQSDAPTDRPASPVDHESRHLIEEGTEVLLGFGRQRGLRKGIVHQPHPVVARCPIDLKWHMPRPQPRVATLLDIPLRPAEPVNQKIAQSFLPGRKLVVRGQFPQNGAGGHFP